MSFIDFLTSSFIVGTGVFLLMFLMLLSIRDELRRYRHEQVMRQRIARMRGGL